MSTGDIFYRSSNAYKFVYTLYENGEITAIQHTLLQSIVGCVVEMYSPFYIQRIIHVDNYMPQNYAESANTLYKLHQDEIFAPLKSMLEIQTLIEDGTMYIRKSNVWCSDTILYILKDGDRYEEFDSPVYKECETYEDIGDALFS